MKVRCESEVTLFCPTRSDPIDCSLPDSSVHGIFQTRVLEWVAISFSGTVMRILQIRHTPLAVCSGTFRSHLQPWKPRFRKVLLSQIAGLKNQDVLPPGGPFSQQHPSTWGFWELNIQFSRSVMSDSLRPHELQHARPPCPSPTPGVYSNSCPSSR